LARQRKNSAEEAIEAIEVPVASTAASQNAHPVMKEMLSAVRDRDVDSYARTVSLVVELTADRQRLQEFEHKFEGMSTYLPKLMNELKLAPQDACWDDRIPQIKEAWHWEQARFWIDEYIDEDDVPDLSKEVKKIADDIHELITQLAALRAWKFCFKRMKNTHQEHMEAWRLAMGRVGKGTGKWAPKHRRDAQKHLKQCQEAVPAWVMPLHRIWDTMKFAPGLFDVIIVDEASQCGLEALPLLYLGKKILIVGDDKQISPEGGFVPVANVNLLQDEYLYGYELKDSFAINTSLFDHAKIRFHGGLITLREHFRCMPEIIRFSNRNFYSGTPLIPLRQYGRNRLNPVEHVHVATGYREGQGANVINEPEAEALVDKIRELCEDSRYNGDNLKTFGVIALQGSAQARLIEELLLTKLGPEKIEQRDLICGKPYSFQGDERDIMFLSMVAAPNEQIGPFTAAPDERRFNVAASRARDQMYLFHSVTTQDLSPNDLRRRLLEFFQNPEPYEIAGKPLEELELEVFNTPRMLGNQPEPFDSWFEVDVALELLRKGYEVIPQFEFARRKIDLVVEGGKARLAVECDGDVWHGPDQWDADQARQRQLERCGWVFHRIKYSRFCARKEKEIELLERVLREIDIFPSKVVQ
jgi:very-short-patch-repair endonuclease